MTDIPRYIVALLIGLLSGSVTPDYADQILSFNDDLSSKEIGQTPEAWVSFCSREPSDCVNTNYDIKRIPFTRENFEKISRIDGLVNSTTEYLSDTEHWGELDHWSYVEDGKGDCEDYALEKRRRLIAEGFPPSALQLAIMYRFLPSSESNLSAQPLLIGHAMLRVLFVDETGKTVDKFLDLASLTGDLQPRSNFNYIFDVHQSAWNPNIWVKF